MALPSSRVAKYAFGTIYLFLLNLSLLNSVTASDSNRKGKEKLGKKILVL